MIYYKNINGQCPYCNSSDLLDATNQPEHPYQTAKLCGECQKFTVLFNQRGITYPLVNPLNSLSSPAVSIEQ